MASQNTDPWLALSAGIIANAAKDAKRGDPEAISWLVSDECAHACECLGVDFASIQRWVSQRTAKEAARMNNNNFMNNLIRGKKAIQSQQPIGPTDAQAGQIEKYVNIGATFAEAWDLVMSAQPDQPLPIGNAGSGAGNPPPAKRTMNEIIREKSGHG